MLFHEGRKKILKKKYYIVLTGCLFFMLTHIVAVPLLPATVLNVNLFFKRCSRVNLCRVNIHTIICHPSRKFYTIQHVLFTYITYNFCFVYRMKTIQ